MRVWRGGATVISPSPVFYLSAATTAGRKKRSRRSDWCLLRRLPPLLHSSAWISAVSGRGRRWGDVAAAAAARLARNKVKWILIYFNYANHMPQIFGVKLRGWAFSFLSANFQWGSREEQAVETALRHHSHTRSQLGFLSAFWGLKNNAVPFVWLDGVLHVFFYSMTGLMMCS